MLLHNILQVMLWGSLAAVAVSILVVAGLWRAARCGPVDRSPGWVISSGVVVPASGIVPELIDIELCPHCGRVL